VLKLPPKESYNEKEGSRVMVLTKPNLVRIIAMMHKLRLKHWETYYSKKFMWYIYYAHKKHLLNWSTIVYKIHSTLLRKSILTNTKPKV
jgi:hypothetical protein